MIEFKKVETKEDFKIFNFYDTYYRDETYCLILALDREQPVGFINGYLKEKVGIFTIENTGLITSLYVKPEYRNGAIVC